MTIEAISSNHKSVDEQISDAMDWLKINAPGDYARIVEQYPEWLNRKWLMPGEAWLDTEAMGVDEEWSSWLADAIEQSTNIYWEDGEPYASVD